MLDYDSFIELHKSQLELSNVPQHFWGTLHKKLINQAFDAGAVFTLLRVEYDTNRGPYDAPWVLQVNAETGLTIDNPNNIYLIDHAWTFRIENAQKQLRSITSLRERMASIMGIEITDNDEELCEEIFDELWKYCNHYSIQETENAEDRIPIWYVLDEVGSAVHHSNSPNCQIVPFIFIPDKTVYSLIFPVENVDDGEMITRNFVEESTSATERDALLLPWIYTSFDDVNFEHEKPNPDYFLNGHVHESLPILSQLQHQQPIKNVYNVFSEYALLREYLTDPFFNIVNNEEDADILWYMQHFTKFKQLSCMQTHKFVNQFPFEYILSNKDLLSLICSYDSGQPPWLPVTYNLKTEVDKFVSYYMHCEREGLDNHWIIKPFNLARGLDTYITKNLNYIVRLARAGSRIVQKYIDNPILFYRPDCAYSVKFDVRYVILLKSIKPLQAYVYKRFFLRFANHPFEMRHFDDYETHFTVMNYTDNVNLKHMLCSDFMDMWKRQYVHFPWKNVEETILRMLREVLKCATQECPPCGISESPQSRALYAADVMLEWTEKKDIQPKLLEINWMPDCERACKYYPDFFNEIFKLLFCDVTDPVLFYNLIS